MLDALFRAGYSCLSPQLITEFAPLICLVNQNGAVAQLGERMTGSHEVRGSIPLGSTNNINNSGHPLRMPKLFCVLVFPLRR